MVEKVDKSRRQVQQVLCRPEEHISLVAGERNRVSVTRHNDRNNRREAFKNTYDKFKSASLIDCGLSKFLMEHISTKNTQEVRNELIEK